ncbi:hypothetical protein ACU60T_24970 [Klebsiella aerogenes]
MTARDGGGNIFVTAEFNHPSGSIKIAGGKIDAAGTSINDKGLLRRKSPEIDAGITDRHIDVVIGLNRIVIIVNAAVTPLKANVSILVNIVLLNGIF